MVPVTTQCSGKAGLVLLTAAPFTVAPAGLSATEVMEVFRSPVRLATAACRLAWVQLAVEMALTGSGMPVEPPPPQAANAPSTATVTAGRTSRAEEIRKVRMVGSLSSEAVQEASLQHRLAAVGRTQ